MDRKSRYDIDLDRNPANYAALTPLDFLSRAASVHPGRTAIVHGARRQTYAETYARCRRLAGALAAHGIKRGDTVSVLAPNIPETLEAHFAVPMSGAVLNALNIRLDAALIGRLLEHAESKLVFVDREFAPLLYEAMDHSGVRPYVVTVDDPEAEAGDVSLGDESFEHFIAGGAADHDWQRPEDEWDAITLSYTSGTTGNPKGVVYHHRGAYLNSLSNAFAVALTSKSVYLWTLPMFHCNGWTYTWAVTAMAGTHICLRRIESARIFQLIADEGVTHMAGAPVVLNMIANAPMAERQSFAQQVEVTVGGAPPPSAVIAAMEGMGFRVTHLYGLTECYGPSLISEWQDDWPALTVEARAEKMARQGVPTLAVSEAIVADPESGLPLAADGQSMGEILLRGNTLMKGYLANPEETKRAFASGWFHTGDLGVMHEDGYIELRDRSKDVIISGGENISSVEVENVLYRHPNVQEAAVVAKADDKWGETPLAFVYLKVDAGDISAESIIAFCRDHLAHFKVPSAVIFGPLPKTATGKIQKFVLRERANSS
ncbi:MAG: long-chain-fatty-acid--CoA ligase [Proteobacteria bacterium]|nr:long-chain-fatty-acid--CoA ligase [Pseudomonadota bacterium]MDA1354960.1 long-chain-fatty-acid--CoA ligase [Pseudomonadota bacterium]